MRSGRLFRKCSFAGAAVIVAGVFFLAQAQAHVIISSGATKNMSCSGGICAPTAKNAVLNAGDLETMLASGNVTVKTTGAGGVEAYDLQISAPFSWIAANTLTLDSYRWIFVDRPVRVAGPGGLVVLSDDGGTGGNFDCRYGRISFANLSSPLTVNGKSYTLVNSVKSLAAAIANNASGDYALADNYNAKQDGTYSSTPVTTYMSGTIEGLGNSISNIQIIVPEETQMYIGGLLIVLNFGGIVENLNMPKLNITMAPYQKGVAQDAGGLLVTNQGTLFNDHVSGKISVDAEDGGVGSLMGGLVALNDAGTISSSSAAVQMTGENIDAGGLGGNFSGTIVYSYATGSVKVTDENGETYLGAFASGNGEGFISNSYATGTVEGVGQPSPPIGGFSGSNTTNNETSVSYSYSTSRVIANGGLVGGFIGQYYDGSFTDCYWDATKDQIGEGTGEGNVPGISGLTSKQLKKSLPPGFDPTIWAQDRKINNGYPYLIANPPRE